MSLQDLPRDERPRERLAHLGAGALSSRELLAALLGTGARGASALDVAGELLGSGLHGLAARSLGELEQVRGLGRAKATRVLAALELGARLASDAGPAAPSLQSPGEAARYLLPRYSSRPVETFGLLALDARHRLRREAGAGIGISLDGPTAAIADRTRRTWGGNGVFAQTVKVLEDLAGYAGLNVMTGDPLLASLANNGGFTQTHALNAGSPAIDAGGVNSACASTDQRGTARPQGSACDIGSYEYEGGVMATPTFTSTPTATPVVTATFTATPEITNTPIPPTDTPTQTPVPPTPTNTLEVTPTFTATFTATPSPTRQSKTRHGNAAVPHARGSWQYSQIMPQSR